MLTNGFLKNKNRLKVIQKAIMTGIGATASKEVIKKAAVGLYDDIQKIVHTLLGELEKKGKLKTKETKLLLKELQKRSEVEKAKIYKKLLKDSKNLLKTAKDIILTPVVIAKEFKVMTKNSKIKTKRRKRTSGKRTRK